MLSIGAHRQIAYNTAQPGQARSSYRSNGRDRAAIYPYPVLDPAALFFPSTLGKKVTSVEL